jgi:sulfatase maturation enzyme AslB (radical SAM superfamily)
MKLINPEVRIETTNGATLISPFGFGESLLDSGIAKKVEYCTRLNLKTFITTNATLLTIQLIHDLLEAGLSKIRFSLHGRGKNYELVHRGFTYVETFRNVSNFLQINKVKFDSACTTCVTVIPMHGERVEDIVEYWEERVDEVEVWKPHNFSIPNRYRKGKRVKKTCGRPERGPVQIQSDAKIIPCCFLINNEIVLGDTRKNSIEDILKGEKYEELRESHRTGDLEGLVCECCDQLLEEKESPLLYSSRDLGRKSGKTSSMKFDLGAE